jgi:HEAT repeat protein
MSVHFFCPSCWIEVTERAARCPECGYDLSEFVGLPHEEKLLLALRNPIPETQRMAVHLLGRLGSERALTVFEELLSSSSDPYLLREVVEALARIPGSRSARLLEIAARHPSVLVSEAARARHAAHPASRRPA